VDNIKPFDTNAHCSACGHHSVSVKYFGRCKWPNDENRHKLHRICGRCGYSWWERPLFEEGLEK